jgi:outer membrane beta-barrel protein
MKTPTTTLIKTTMIATLMMSATALAQTAQNPSNQPPVPSSSPVKNTGSDKVDLKKLEDKYWSAKDDEYGVIQNRTFAKSGKFYLSLVYGPLINDPYAKARATGGMLGYYLSEDFGIELDYLNYNSTKNQTVTDFQGFSGGANPAFNLMKASKTLSVTYTPFYAKMAFMNKAIMYFDMGFTLGVGQTDYEIQKVDRSALNVPYEANERKSAQHFEIGIMQQLFLSQYFAFRADIKNSFYTQKLQTYDVPYGQTHTESDKSVNDTTITFGLTLFTK